MLHIFRKYPFWLLAAFLLSVIVRLPGLNRPLSKHHEFNTAMVLVGCEGWAAAGGPANVNFTPLINYPNAGDVYYLEHPQVKDGKLHYLSFGPGQFVLPYYTGKIFHTPYSPLLLQMINLLAQLVSAWFIYRLALLLSGGETTAKIASLFFLFSAETLWFFGNGYVHESMVMPFFAAGLHLSFRFFTDATSITAKNSLWFGLIVFTGIFFDWLMLFFAAGAGIMALVRVIKKDKRYRKLFVITAIGAIAATTCIIFMYSSYYGWDRFWALLLNKYETRNGMAGESGSTGTRTMLLLAKHFATGYLPLLLLLVGGVMMLLKKKLTGWRGMGTFLMLQISVLVYFLVFASFSAAHDYSVLKFSILIAVLGAITVEYLFVRKKQQLILATVIVLLNIALYYYINPPGNKGFNGDAYALEKNAGEFIRSKAEPDELVLQNMPDANWLAVYYYSKRNNMYMPDADSAHRFFLTTPAKKMVFVDFSGGNKTIYRYQK